MASSAVEKIQVGVTLNSNGGSGCSGTTNYILGENYNISCQPTRTDYTFMGWYNEGDYKEYSVGNGMSLSDSGTTVFGPYIPLDVGNYKAVITGSGLSDLNYKVYQWSPGIDYTITNSVITDNMVVLYFNIHTAGASVEILSEGVAGSFTYDSMKLYKEVTSSNIVSIDTDHTLTANWDDTSNPVINSFNTL